MKLQKWFVYALLTTLFWGVWGALIEIPEKAGFPATMGYIVWAAMMIPCAVIALWNVNWRLQTQRRSVVWGLVVGLTGAIGQVLLFQALRTGPAYIVFPFVSLYPILTIILSILILKEKATKKQMIGVVLALGAIVLLSYQKPDGSIIKSYGWLGLALVVFVLWGIQAYAMKFANELMSAESIFFYMALSGLLLTPIAYLMTDFSQPINWSFKGPYLAAMIQVLNAIGALMLVYALRFGKAIIVVPLTGLAPVITIGLSLFIYSKVPDAFLLVGIVVACIAMFLISD